MKLNKKGFTLLEIIIVIIIIGVLAALALPRFFSMVEYSKATEALNAFTTIRGSMERCLTGNNGTYAGCDFVIADNIILDIQDPSLSSNAHFGYVITTSVQNPNGYTITATRNALDGGNITDTITLTQTPNTVTKSGTGAFVNIR